MEIIDQGPGQLPDNASSWELEIRDILRDFENQITGKIPMQDPDNPDNYYLKTDRLYALINERGARFIMSRLGLIVNKYTALSMADDDQIRKFVMNFADALRVELRLKRDEFDIKRHNFESLILCIAQFTYMGLCKSINEGERKYRRGIERRVWTIPGTKGWKDAVTGIFKGSGDKKS